MLKTDNIYFYLILLTLLATVVGAVFIGFLDEFIALLTGLVVLLDAVVNNRWKRYSLLYAMVAIMGFYAVMSMTCYNFNTTKAILYDFVLQMKPLLPLAVFYAARPTLTERQKQIVRITCVSLSVFSSAVLVVGLNDIIFGHVVSTGNAIYTLFLFYLYCTPGPDGTLTRRRLAIALLLVALGVVCTRSKYYGEMGAAIFMLLAYKPGMMRQVKPSHILSLLAVIVVVAVLIYPKLEYYFLQSLTDDISEEEVNNMARPALYYGMGMILGDYPIFGSGLASFAVFASSPDVNYSSLYADYHLDKVWGLSESMPDFICDAFYPELAQFGFVGIALFLLLWFWACRRLRIVLRQGDKTRFIAGVLCIAFVLIESTTGSTFTKCYGEAVMMLLGMIIAPTRTMSKEERNDILRHSPNYTNKPSLITSK